MQRRDRANSTSGRRDFDLKTSWRTGTSSPLADTPGENFGKFLEWGDRAGAARDASMRVVGSEPGSDMFDDLCCAGLAVVSGLAIREVMERGSIPEMTGLAQIARQAVNLTIRDGSSDVFGRHVTRDVGNPSISLENLWSKGRSEMHFGSFRSL